MQTATVRPKKTTVLMGLFLILECMLWGVGNPLLKFAIVSITPIYCLMIRFILGAIILFIVFRKRIIVSFKREHIKPCLVVSIFTGAAFITANLGIAATTATNAGFLMSLAVLFVPFLSFVILKKHVRPIHFLWIFIVIVGMYLICGNSGEFIFGFGEAISLVCSLCYAFIITLSEKVLKNVDAMFLATFQAAVTGVMCMVIAPIFEGKLDITAIQPVAWGVIAYLIIGCTCIAYILQNVALKSIPSEYASVLLCSEPIFTYIASYFLLGETLSINGMIGGALIILSIVAASLSQNDKKAVST